jgi:hypothetical protein
VRRLVAFALIQALAVSTSMAASLHVHEYLGHDHPDHHHGPASHDHQQPPTVDRDHHAHADDEDHPAWQADPCEPGRHATGVSMTCACVPQAHVDLAEVPQLSLVRPIAPARAAVAVIDVRVHGPPFDARIPARAPPVSHLA